MAGFSIQDAAFTGFRVVRQHRGCLIIWAAMALMISVVLTVAIIALAGPDFMRLQSLGAHGGRDPAAVVPLLGRLAPVYLLLTPAVVVFYGVLYAAMNRSVLRPDDDKFGFLGFGADELRQIALLLIGGLLFSALYIVVLIMMILLSVLLNPIMHAPPALSGMIAVVASVLVVGWVAVRMSLASALTFESRRVDLFGSWVLTKGRFWPISGVYVLVLALAAIILFLTSLVVLAAVAVATGGNLGAAFAPADMSSLRAYFTPAHWLQLVLGAGVSAVLWPVVLTPSAAILREISSLDTPNGAVKPQVVA